MQEAAEAPPSDGEGVTVAAAVDEASTEDAFEANDEDAVDVDVDANAVGNESAGTDFAGQREAPATK